MTREILFRAKQMSCRKWCEGSLVKDKTGCHIITPDANIFYHVDENTICQYTGLTDKNGTKIFENDILLINEELFTVKWDDETARFFLDNNDADSDFDTYYWGYELKVIGNIFDNRAAEDGQNDNK